jgi:hypothetical protein
MSIRKVPPITQPQDEPCCAPMGAERLPVPGAAQPSRQFTALAGPVRLRMLPVPGHRAGRRGLRV